MSKGHDYETVARMEYAPAEAPAMLVPVFLSFTAIPTVEPVLRYLEAVAAFFLLYTAGFISNSLEDLEVDRKCQPEVAQAHEALGTGTLKRILAFQLVAATLLGAHLGWQLNSVLPVVLVLLGIFFGVGYSLPPFKFKVRGVGHIVALSLSAFFLPFMFLLFSINGTLTLELMVVVAGFTIAHYGLTLTNQSQDMLEDASVGDKTPAVRWGLLPTLRLATGLSITGLIVLGIGWAFMVFRNPPLETLGTLGSAIGAGVGLTAIVLLGWQVPLRGLRDLISITTTEKTDKKRIKRIRGRINYPKWQASGIMGTVLASALLFVLHVAA